MIRQYMSCSAARGCFTRRDKSKRERERGERGEIKVIKKIQIKKECSPCRNATRLALILTGDEIVVSKD